MKAKVVAVHSATSFTDNRERITLRFDVDSMFNEIRLPNFGLQLDEEVKVEFAEVDEAYGEGTSARLFLCSTCESADNLKPCHYCKQLFCADCLNEHEGGCGSVDPGSQRP